MSEIAENLKWLRQRRGVGKITRLANAIETDRTTVSKILSGERRPTLTQQKALAEHFGVPDSADLDLPHEQFVEKYEASYSSLLLRSFRAIRAHLPRLETVYKAYRGQYFVYYDPTRDGKRVIASLLDIQRLTGEAIELRFINPYQLQPDEWSCYDYSGYLFPVGQTLYVLAEQKDNDYEVLSILIQMSHGPEVRLLKGLITGVGVKREEDGSERSSISARPALFLKCKTRIDDWRSAIPQDLGFLPRNKLPEFIRRQLNDHRVDLLSDGSRQRST